MNIKDYKILIIGLIVAFNLSGILSTLASFITICKPIWIGVLFAFILNLIMSHIDDSLSTLIKKHRVIRRIISIILTFIVVWFITSAFFNLVIPEIIKSTTPLINSISNLNETIDNWEWLNKTKLINRNQVIDIVNSLQKNSTVLIKEAVSNIGNLSSTISSVFSTSIGIVADVFSGLIVCFFILLTKESIIERCSRYLKVIFVKYYDDVIHHLNNFYNIFERFIGRRLIESLILATLEYIGCLIFNMPYAMIIGVLTFLLSMIPYFGCFVVWIIGMILATSSGMDQVILFAIVYQIITIAESNFIYPYVIGKSLGLPEIWTIVGLIIFGKLFGFVGMLIADPCVACIYYVVQNITSHQEKKLKINDIDITEKINETNEKK